MVYRKFLTYKFYLHVDISYLIIITVLIQTMQIFNLKIHKTFEKKSQRIHASEECQLCVKSTGLSHYIFPSSSFILALLLSFNFLFLCTKQSKQRARETVQVKPLETQERCRQESHYLLIGFVHIPPMDHLGNLLPSILVAISIKVNISFQQMDCKLVATQTLTSNAR